MIIDIHTHTFPDKIAAKAVDKLKHNSHTQPFLDGTAACLSSSCKEAGIDLAVIQPIATTPKQVESINDGAIEMNRHSMETHLVSFGCMHPEYEDPEREMARIASAGIKGIKLHPVYHKVDADDPAYVRLLLAAAVNGLIVLFHAGIDVGFLEERQSSVKKIARAIDAVPAGRYILAHMGGWRQWEEATRLFAGCDNIWVDTSFSLGDMVPVGDDFYKTHSLERLSAEQFLAMKETFGAEKLLFGTDSPWEDQATEVSRIRNLPIPEHEKAAILGGNAERFLAI